MERFIVPSRFYLEKLCESGIPREKLVWIPSFTRMECYEPRFGGDDYFVYLGRLSDEKGVMTLIEAVRGMRRGRLVVIGEGPERAALARGRQRLRDVPRGRDSDPKYGDDLRRLLRNARFSVIPSEWYENCPRSCIESFASGTPVIGADIGGIPEMVRHGETGLLFEPFSTDALRGYGSSSYSPTTGWRPGWGRAARARAEDEYSAPRHIERLLGVYEETLASAA